MGFRFTFSSALVRLEQVGNGVEAEAVDTHVEPITNHLEHFLLHRGVAVVEVGLVAEEPVEVELPSLRVKRPVRRLGVAKNNADIGPQVIGV